MRIEPTYKKMTPPSTQNLKTLGLWIFFLICCSTFSFLLIVGLRLTLGYLIERLIILVDIVKALYSFFIMIEIQLFVSLTCKR